MAAKNTVTAENLAALGADRLAELLVELGDRDAAIKRRLRLELVGAGSPADLAKEIRKRLATIARSKGFVDWEKRKSVIADLQAQRRAIVEQVAPRMPGEGLELLWQFLELSDPVLQRCDDSSGSIASIFEAAVDDLGTIAQSARPNARELASRVFTSLTERKLFFDVRLIRVLQNALGPAGLEHLKQRLTVLAAQPASKSQAKQPKVLGWGSGGAIYAHDFEAGIQARMVQSALREIADAQGDVDAYIAQYDAATRKVPHIAAEIARRLVAAKRNDEAWNTLEAVELRPGRLADPEWEEARFEVLDAMGRGDEAQAARLGSFEQSLTAQHLRDYLKRLPDFDDFDAEQRALDFVERWKDATHAVYFLVNWPSLDRAARVVTQRAAELDGNHYETLTPAAEALAGKYPLAATVALRTMIDYSLTHAKASRYGHAARHLRDCAGLAAAIWEWATFAPHADYVARLRREHARKVGFWTLVDKA